MSRLAATSVSRLAFSVRDRHHHQAPVNKKKWPRLTENTSRTQFKSQESCGDGCLESKLSTTLTTSRPNAITLCAEHPGQITRKRHRSGSGQLPRSDGATFFGDRLAVHRGTLLIARQWQTALTIRWHLSTCTLSSTLRFPSFARFCHC